MIASVKVLLVLDFSFLLLNLPLEPGDMEGLLCLMESVNWQAELGRPPAGRPKHGSLVISVECSPTAAPEFEVHLTLQLCSDHRCSVFIVLGQESSSHSGGCNNLKEKFLFLLEFCQ